MSFRYTGVGITRMGIKRTRRQGLSTLQIQLLNSKHLTIIWKIYTNLLKMENFQRNSVARKPVKIVRSAKAQTEIPPAARLFLKSLKKTTKKTAPNLSSSILGRVVVASANDSLEYEDSYMIEDERTLLTPKKSPLLRRRPSFKILAKKLHFTPSSSKTKKSIKRIFGKSIGQVFKRL